MPEHVFRVPRWSRHASYITNTELKAQLLNSSPSPGPSQLLLLCLSVSLKLSTTLRTRRLDILGIWTASTEVEVRMPAHMHMFATFVYQHRCHLSRMI